MATGKVPSMAFILLPEGNDSGEMLFPSSLPLGSGNIQLVVQEDQLDEMHREDEQGIVILVGH